MTIKPKSPRWYQWKDGQIAPCYELPKKGSSGMKAYSLREARELKLLPSVTTVLSVIDKPDLDNWRVSQAIHSALTLPRQTEDYLPWANTLIESMPHKCSSGVGETLANAYANPPRPLESEDAFAERVLADAEAQSNKAAEFGTRIHDAIADYIQFRKRDLSSDLMPFIEPFMEWADENIEEVHAVEQVVGHPSVGVAGRMDLDCTLKGVGRCIPDFKSQSIKDGKARFWDDWLPQLAAYSMCCYSKDKINRRIASVVIPSNEPGPVSVKVWTDEEFQDGWRLFNSALEIWVILRGRGYDPRQQ